jgi:hypothetical protein
MASGSRQNGSNTPSRRGQAELLPVLDRKCKAKTKEGGPCRAIAVRDDLCNLHSDPKRAAELGRRSGQARRFVVSSGEPEPVLPPPRTATDVRNVLGQVMSDVRGRRLDPKIASTLAYIASVVLRSIEISDVHERVAVLEEVLKVTPKRNATGGWR